MINIDKITKFINNIEYVTHMDYEKVFAQIYENFKGDEWLSRTIVSFLLYEKFDEDYDIFIETAKDSLKHNRPFPTIEENLFIEIIENVIDYFYTNPKLFEYIVPIHPYSLICLYKAKGTSEIFNDYLDKLKERDNGLYADLLQYNLIPEKVFGVITFENEEDFSLILNDENYNAIYYRFQFDQLDYQKDFLPKMAFYSQALLKQEINYASSLNKSYLHKPIDSSIKGKILPVMMKIRNEEIWFSLHVREKHNLELPVDFDLKEALEGVLTLEPLAVFKMINLKDSFVDAESIAQLIQTKKNRSLKLIFNDYYQDKYKDQPEIKINGCEIYQSFIDSDDFIIQKNELIDFTQMIPEMNISPDKAKYILFYKRMKKEVPMLTKPIINIKKLVKKIYK